MKKLLVFMSIAIIAIAFSGCREEAEITTEQEHLAEEAAVVVEETLAEAETMNVEEQPSVQPGEVVEEEVVVKEEETPVAVEEPVTDQETPELVEDVVEEAVAVVEEPTTEQETPAAVETAVEEVDSDNVVVTVNGQQITEEEVSVEVAKRIEGQKKQMPAGQEIPESYPQQMRMRVVDTKVQQAILSQEAKKEGINITDDQVMEEIKKIAGKQSQSIEEVEKEIAGFGMTLEDLMGQIRYQMQGRALMKAKTSGMVVADADAKKFYEENSQLFVASEGQIRASHILCGKPGIAEEEYPAELEKIKAAKARLDAGESFEDVAMDVSTCPSGKKGGDLGFFGKRQMDPAFEKAAFELEIGQTTGIVKTSVGYHIIKRTGNIEFDEAKEQIVQFLTQQKQQTLWTEYSRKIVEDAAIEYSDKEKAFRDVMEKAAAEQAALRKAQLEKARAAQKAAPAPDPAPQPETPEEE